MDRAEAEAIFDARRDVCVQFILDLADRVERVEERLRRLEEQARQDSRTSSKPPSSDPPKTRQQQRAEARAKAKELLRGEHKAGGQPGHRGWGRELKPENQVDEIVDHIRRRAAAVAASSPWMSAGPAGGLVAIRWRSYRRSAWCWSSHRNHRVGCRECGGKTTGGLPAGVGGSAFGANLQAALVTLIARNRISRRGMIELASDLFGVTVSTGTVDAICQRASDALAGPHAQLHDWVLDQRAVHVDETGWRTAGDGRALWTLTTRTRRSFGSPSTATASSSRRSSAPTPGSSSPIAGTAMSTATRTGAKCAGHTSSATSPPLRRTRRAEDLRRDRPRTHASGVQGMARLPARAPRSQTAQPADSAPSNRTTRTTARRLAREPAAATCRLQRRSLSAYLRDLLIAHNRGDPSPALTEQGPWTERLETPG